MAIKDLFNCLYTEAIGKTDDKGDTVASQKDFAEKYGVERETLIGWTLGHQTPSIYKIKEVVEGEGYTLDDCIEPPVKFRRKAEADQPQLFRNLEEIILSGDTDRIKGIAINLHDIAAGARDYKKAEKREAAKAAKQERGNTKRKVKKKVAASG